MSDAMNFDHLVELCRLTHEEMQPTLSGELAKSALSSRIQPTPSVELATTHQTAAELIKSVENLIRLATEGQVVENPADLIPAPTVRSKQAQGIALGYNPKTIQALKGRPNPPWLRRSKKPRQNGSRLRAQRFARSPGRPDMARLPYPNPTFQPCAITSPDNRSITGRSHSRTNTEPSWCDTELISMNDTSGISVSPWAAHSGLHSLSFARPRALPWAGMICPVGAQEVLRLEQITNKLEGGEPL